MSVSVRTDVDGPRARVSLAGPFELAHAAAITGSLAGLDESLHPHPHVDVDLSAVLESALHWTSAGRAVPIHSQGLSCPAAGRVP